MQAKTHAFARAILRRPDHWVRGWTFFKDRLLIVWDGYEK